MVGLLGGEGAIRRQGVVLGMVSLLCLVASVGGIGANWGTQTNHSLPPDIVVQMLKDNGIQRVKLFDADEGSMNALKKSGIEVMVGIPNDMLATLASGMKPAEDWVSKNVSSYVNDGVNIRYVAVGNEPFLTTYNETFVATTFPALQNIQSSLIKAGLSSQIKVTIPLNADVYQSLTNLPSGGDFRPDIHDLMISIVKYLSDNAGPLTVNTYPFISLYNDPSFPLDYAFFDGISSPVNDGGVLYTNVFDANLDTFLWALKKNGFANLPIIVGEVGWPTDGDKNANLRYAQRFNQGLMSRIRNGSGTPMLPGPIDAYLFSLIDEDEKSIRPGNFERHWGIFYYDGTPKYQLNLGSSKTGGLVSARNVKYLDKKWCILKSSVNLDDPRVPQTVSYACANADCTSLGYMTSCGNLDARGNISYAFNSYYQRNYQDDIACKFSGLATVTTTDPSTGTCRFAIMIDDTSAAGTRWKFLGVGKEWINLTLYYTFITFFLSVALL